MDEEEKTTARLYILSIGICVFLFIFCFGSRQLALLENRIAQEARYEHLEQELVELSEEALEDIFFDET